jgi:hypothetical protein
MALPQDAACYNKRDVSNEACVDLSKGTAKAGFQGRWGGGVRGVGDVRGVLEPLRSAAGRSRIGNFSSYVRFRHALLVD